MADSNIKKIVIKQSDLPPINSNEEKYVVRFRILSEDRNRTSHWSPQYLIQPNQLELQDNFGITLSSTGGFIELTWDVEPGSSQSYDVWLAWGSQEGSTGLPQYKATINGNYVAVPIPSGMVSVQAFIQNMSVPRKFLPSLVIAQSGIETV